MIVGRDPLRSSNITTAAATGIRGLMRSCDRCAFRLEERHALVSFLRCLGWQGARRPVGLLDDRDQVRLDNPLVGSEEPKAMDASRGNNHPVRRISQRATQRGNFLGDVGAERNNFEDGICVQLIEQIIHASADRLTSLAKQHDFEQGNGADSVVLSAPDRLIENTGLLAR